MKYTRNAFASTSKQNLIPVAEPHNCGILRGLTCVSLGMFFQGFGYSSDAQEPCLGSQDSTRIMIYCRVGLNII